MLSSFSNEPHKIGGVTYFTQNGELCRHMLSEINETRVTPIGQVIQSLRDAIDTAPQITETLAAGYAAFLQDATGTHIDPETMRETAQDIASSDPETLARMQEHLEYLEARQDHLPTVTTYYKPFPFDQLPKRPHYDEQHFSL